MFPSEFTRVNLNPVSRGPALVSAHSITMTEKTIYIRDLEISQDIIVNADCHEASGCCSFYEPRH